MFPLYSRPSSLIGWGHGGWGMPGLVAFYDIGPGNGGTHTRMCSVKVRPIFKSVYQNYLQKWLIHHQKYAFIKRTKRALCGIRECNYPTYYIQCCCFRVTLLSTFWQVWCSFSTRFVDTGVGDLSFSSMSACEECEECADVFPAVWRRIFIMPTLKWWLHLPLYLLVNFLSRNFA